MLLMVKKAALLGIKSAKNTRNIGSQTAGMQTTSLKLPLAILSIDPVTSHQSPVTSHQSPVNSQQSIIHIF